MTNSFGSIDSWASRILERSLLSLLPLTTASQSFFSVSIQPV